MTRAILRYLVRIFFALIALITLLLSPIAYIETMCLKDEVPSNFISMLPAEYHRTESRTFLTYPEWHIVNAYDDYAKVIQLGDPHDYEYLKSISGFWSSLCTLSKKSASHGGFDFETKQTIYSIGVSFSAEFIFKGLYEETLGRVSTWIRGDQHSRLDKVSAQQSADYAKFLQQVPWYKWDFAENILQLSKANTGSFRDQERNLALGSEFRVKRAYSNFIDAAVEKIGPDALSLRMIVEDLPVDILKNFKGVTVIKQHPAGIEIETPRYRKLTHLLVEMALEGANFIEISGNDDIMLSANSKLPYNESLFSVSRQGYGDQRHLIEIKVKVLAEWIRKNDISQLQLEHIFDY